MIIGLTGTNGAGKTEISNYLVKRGFEFFSLSDVIRDELKKNGLQETRENLISKGNELREKFGPSVLTERIVRKIKKDAIVDSIRNVHEIERLRKEHDFVLLAIDAPIKLRYERLKKRKRSGDNISLQDFKKYEEMEKKGSKNAQQLEKCMKLSDHTIINDSTLEEFHRKIDMILGV